MDLGKMLAEALEGNGRIRARVAPSINDGLFIVEGLFDLRRAAEAFLAKVREAESGINYRDLLQRYMAHVGECEGVTFVHRLAESDPHGLNRIAFTSAEVDTLLEIDAMPNPPDHTGPAPYLGEVE